MNEKEVEISVDKKYKLPNFTIVKHKEYYLAIAKDVAKWLVLENEVQKKIFKRIISGANIQELIDEFEDYQEEIVFVLTQLEAKEIENTNVNSIFANDKLHLHLTNICNLRCPHCYMESGNANTNELTTNEIKNLCYNFRNWGGTDVSLTGGEPTIRKDFLEIVEYISSLGMKVSVFSNGCLWTEDMVQKLSKYNIDGVQVSIDGYDEASNAIVRGQGSFEKALQTIDWLVKYGIFVKIAVTAPYEIIKHNKEKYIEFSKKMLSQYGENAIDFNYSYYLMEGRELSQEDIAVFKRDYYQTVDSVVKEIYGDTSEDAFVENLWGNKIYDSCGYGGLNVMSNGDFYFCDRIPDVQCISNIRDMSFEDISRLMEEAEKLGKIDNFKPCKDCELKYICGGGCRAEYFKSFTKKYDIQGIDFSQVEPKMCSSADKERIYDLMIKTNERFFC